MGEPREPYEEMIAKGARLAGAVGGGVLGATLAGPVGAAVGSATGWGFEQALRRVGNELSIRLLGPRAELRIGAALAVAQDVISARILNGETPRDDEFVEVDPTSGRSPAEELAEGVCLVAQNSFEERKLPYLGFLLASFAFEPLLSPVRAHQLLTLAQRLTFRQLVLLTVFGRPDLQVRLPDFQPFLTHTPERVSIETDFRMLLSDNLVEAPSPHVGLFDKLPPPPTPTPSLQNVRRTVTGEWLYRTTGLERIPDEEREELVFKPWSAP